MVQRLSWLVVFGTIALVLVMVSAPINAQTPSPTPSPSPEPTSTPTPLPQTDTRCFPETGYCIQGNIRTYWETHGGLPVFGYPISPVTMETIDNWTGPVQWFERDRLEDHGVAGVLAGRLGATLLEWQGRSWFTFARVSTAPPGCRYFSETGHSLCEPFLSYWDRNGGLERFGYPITEPFHETIETWTGTVQYFERRRMEHHILSPGSPVLLGLLGREVLFFDEFQLAECEYEVLPLLASTYERIDEELRDALGCPTNVFETNVRTALQHFESGIMVWTERSRATHRTIYAIFSDGPTYRAYDDPWREGDPATPDVIPPPGRFAPRGGFGVVWMQDADLRTRMGWAIEEREQFDRATIQVFTNGLILEMDGRSELYMFGPEEEDVQILFSW